MILLHTTEYIHTVKKILSFKVGLCLLTAIDSRYNSNDQCLDLSIILVLVKIRSVSEQLMLVLS